MRRRCRCGGQVVPSGTYRRMQVGRCDECDRSYELRDSSPEAFIGAHVIDRESRLATIVGIDYQEGGPVIAHLRRFNGEDAGVQDLASLEILKREEQA